MTMNSTRSMIGLLALSAVFLTNGCRNPGAGSPPALFSLSTQHTVPELQVIDVLKKNRLVLVGEHHTDPSHHAAQLAVIRFLDAHAIPIAIGLEMLRKDQQSSLDQWVKGDMDEADFEQVYLDNWNFPWSLYRRIFLYARDNHIPMVGLNVSRQITRQVAQDGFNSLSNRQRGELEGITCNVTREYRDFIRSAFGAHGHGNFNFIHFCEAQLVWDTAMAINAVDYLNQHPKRTMVLLAGSGHARKMGIPYQVSTRSSISTTVLLPHAPGILDPSSISTSDADFVIMP